MLLSCSVSNVSLYKSQMKIRFPVFLHTWRDGCFSSLFLNMHLKRKYVYKNFSFHAAAAAKSLQSCPTLCDPIDGSPPGSHIPGILQARTLEWVAISFSNAWKWKNKAKSLIRVRLLATPWTAAHQALPSMGFSRQEYWSGVPFHFILEYNWLTMLW